MAEPPGQPVLDDIGDIPAARGDAGYGGDMIGLERMLHAQQKPQPKNSEHTPPTRYIGSSDTSWKPLSGQDFIEQPPGAVPRRAASRRFDSVWQGHTGTIDRVQA
jgi:hypothetical protein